MATETKTFVGAALWEENGPPPKDLLFGRSAANAGRVVLTALKDFQLTGHVLALVDGIEVGRSRGRSSYAEGDEVEILIQRFPFVGLPNRVRFSSEEGFDLAEPLTVGSPSDAARLAGPGELSCHGLKIENGVLTGQVINKLNGLATPVLIAKINGVFRQVQVGQPRLRDEGGSLYKLSVSLAAEDLTDIGMTLAIFSLPDFEPIGNVHFSRVERDVIVDAVAKLDQRISQLDFKAKIDAAGNLRILEEAVERQQMRLSDAIEYFSVLVHDHRNPPPGDVKAAEEINRTIRSFYETMAASEKAAKRRSAADILTLAPDHAAYGDDWHGLEFIGGRPSRWMPGSATIYNPSAERRVSSVFLSVLDFIGDAAPDIFIHVDDEAAIRGKSFGLLTRRTHTIRFDFPSPRHFGVACLVASRTLRPNELDESSSDIRPLSVHVTGIRLLMEPDHAESF
ncbi:hypothetical protein [Methylobacterium sp. WL7]|uniref:hypothetical protein n=1 Tax=Methylobacterium sp. WL7 TaxID=2603900 RepID=UPI0011CBFA9A|nr:hypothetical protein [Methylobacterium sp. WL7]TXN43411.1 hypothetical protein FV233_18630 [Methylobacterium sp. WL7]